MNIKNAIATLNSAINEEDLELLKEEISDYLREDNLSYYFNNFDNFDNFDKDMSATIIDIEATDKALLVTVEIEKTSDMDKAWYLRDQTLSILSVNTDNTISIIL